MLGCRELSKLPRAPRAKSVNFQSQTPGTVNALLLPGALRPNHFLDPSHPATSVQKKAFPSFRCEELGIRAFPFALLASPEQVWSDMHARPRSLDLWKDRVQRLISHTSSATSTNKPLSFPPMKPYNWKKGTISMSFVNASGKKSTSKDKHIRTKIATKLKMAINLIVSRNISVVEHNGKRKLVTDEKSAEALADEWVAQGWTYIFFPTLRLYRMPYCDMIPLLRRVLRQIYDHARKMERQWESTAINATMQSRSGEDYMAEAVFRRIGPSARADKGSAPRTSMTRPEARWKASANFGSQRPIGPLISHNSSTSSASFSTFRPLSHSSRINTPIDWFQIRYNSTLSEQPKRWQPYDHKKSSLEPLSYELDTAGTTEILGIKFKTPDDVLVADRHTIQGGNINAGDSVFEDDDTMNSKFKREKPRHMFNDKRNPKFEKERARHTMLFGMSRMIQNIRRKRRWKLKQYQEKHSESPGILEPPADDKKIQKRPSAKLLSLLENGPVAFDEPSTSIPKGDSSSEVDSSLNARLLDDIEQVLQEYDPFVRAPADSKSSSPSDRSNFLVCDLPADTSTVSDSRLGTDASHSVLAELEQSSLPLLDLICSPDDIPQVKMMKNSLYRSSPAETFNMPSWRILRRKTRRS